MRCSTFLWMALPFSFSVTPLTSVAGAPLTPGNVLVTNDQALFEYTPGGVLIQSVPIPLGPNHGGADHVRDIVVDASGVVRCYNGTFLPYLSSWDPVANSWTHHTFPGWSQANINGEGGIAVLGTYVFVTDSGTAHAEAAGIIRFDTAAEFAGVRFASDIGFTDLCVGADGLLYALVGGGLNLRVYDPDGLVLLRAVGLSAPVRGIAIAPDGGIFGASPDGYLHRFNAVGELQQTLRIGYVVADIDLLDDGQIVMGMGSSGAFTLTDWTLSPPRFVYVGTYETFVAWVPRSAPTVVRRGSWGGVKARFR